MSKIIILAVSVFVWTVSANETPKEVSKQKAEKTVVPQKQVNAKVPEKVYVTREVKKKSHNYPRGNIATH